MNNAVEAYISYLLQGEWKTISGHDIEHHLRYELLQASDQPSDQATGGRGTAAECPESGLRRDRVAGKEANEAEPAAATPTTSITTTASTAPPPRACSRGGRGRGSHRGGSDITRLNLGGVQRTNLSVIFTRDRRSRGAN